MAGQHPDSSGHFLRCGSYGRRKSGMAAANRQVVSVFIKGSNSSQPDLLWIGAEIKMTIYLIRHGKTEANEKHLYCGSTDLPLSDVGKKRYEWQPKPGQGYRIELGTILSFDTIKNTTLQQKRISEFTHSGDPFALSTKENKNRLEQTF